MKIKKAGQLPDHSDVMEVMLENSSGMSANIMTYGAIIKNLMVPDGNSRCGDVVLGQDTLKACRDNPFSSAAVIGRVANRIEGARFDLNHREYQLERNEYGNCLHSGSANYANRNFTITQGGKSWVSLYLRDCGEGGFPGRASVEITYHVTENSAFEIYYQFIPDEDTPVNLTNHAYFNLSGGKDGTVLGHEMKLNARFYTAADDHMIPTGEILRAAGTRLDFSERRGLDQVLDGAFGLDHNFVLEGTGYRKAAELWYERGKRKMEVYTDQPGIQIYTGNHFDGKTAGKSGCCYEKYAGICFETQNFPNAVNYSHFPGCIVKKNTEYKSKTAYRFSLI